MRKVMLLIILGQFFVAGVTNGQPATGPAPEQLLLQIKSSRSDTNRVKLNLQLGNYYLNMRGEHKNNQDSAYLHFDAAMQLSKALGAVKWQNKTLIMEGNYYVKTGCLKRAKICFDTVAGYYKKAGDKKNEALIWKKAADSFDPENEALNDDQLKYYDQAISLFRQTGDKLNELLSLESIASIHLNQKKFDLAQTELLQVLSHYKSINFKNLQRTYDLLGDVSKGKADLRKELFYRLQAVRSMEAVNDTARAAYYYARAALVCSDLKEYRQSANLIMKSLEILKHHDPDGDFYGDLSLYVYDMIKDGSPQGAIDYLDKITELVPPKNLAQQVDLYEGYGNAYKAMKQYKRAEKYYLEMLRIYQLTYNSKDLYSSNYQMLTDYIHYYQTMGEFYILTKEYKQAGYYLDKILDLPKNDVRPITLSRINHSRFQVDSALGKYLSAIQHYELYKKLNDSLYDVKKSQEIAELMVKYETDKKEQSIQILKSESRSQHAELQKVNLQRNITFGGILMLIVLSSFVYNGYRNKQKSNQLLQSKQTEINRQNKTLQFLLNDKDKLLAEKDWLLREVHHRVKNNLQIVMSLLNTQSAYLESNAAITAIRESQNRVQAISLIHQKLYSTSNVASIDMRAYISDLVSYLHDCLDTIARRIRFEIVVEDIRIDLAQAVPLGLILNEAVTNAIKYAFDENGGNIIIALQWVGKENLLLTVADDGKGLPVEFDIDKTTSLGMELMKALCKQLSGTFEMRNKPGLTVMIDFKVEKIIDDLQYENYYL